MATTFSTSATLKKKLAVYDCISGSLHSFIQIRDDV